jgi:hypothetical protein
MNNDAQKAQPDSENATRRPRPVMTQRCPERELSLRADFFHAAVFAFRAGKAVAPGE